MEKLRYRIFILLTLFILPDAVYSQFNSKHELQMKKYLSPPIDTSTTKEVAFYWGATYPKPEHSIRIIKSFNQFAIEARIFEKNLLRSRTDYDLLILAGKEVSPFSIETFTYITPITDSLKDRILRTFYNVISYNDDSIKPKAKKVNGTVSGVMLYDGPTYKFAINDTVHSQMKIRYQIDSSDFRYQVINTIYQIINDIKNKSFDESKYAKFN